MLAEDKMAQMLADEVIQASTGFDGTERARIRLAEARITLGVVASARAGTEVAAHSSVSVQLAAQEAKAWARLGDRRQTEVALDRGRRLLDALPYPENLAHHFVVDPTKFDFYAMDCYRHLAEDRMAESLANEVIQASTDFDGTERAPMRLAEARITLGVVAAR